MKEKQYFHIYITEKSHPNQQLEHYPLLKQEAILLTSMMENSHGFTHMK